MFDVHLPCLQINTFFFRFFLCVLTASYHTHPETYRPASTPTTAAAWTCPGWDPLMETAPFCIMWWSSQKTVRHRKTLTPSHIQQNRHNICLFLNKNTNFTFQFLKAVKCSHPRVKESVFGSISYSRSRCKRSQCWVASEQAHGCSPSQRHTASWSQLRASLLDSGVKRHDVQKQGKPTQIDWSSRAGIGQWGMCWSGGEDYCCGL